MTELIPTLIVGLLGGLAVGTQSPLAGLMSQRIGSAASSLVVHLGGLLASLVFLAVRGGEGIRDVRTLSWPMLASGCAGLALYLTLGYTVPRIGAAGAIVLVIVGQLVAGLCLDHFGVFGLTARSFDLGRALGLTLVVAGGFLLLR